MNFFRKKQAALDKAELHRGHTRLDDQHLKILSMQGKIAFLENQIKALLDNQIDMGKNYSRVVEALDLTTKMIEKLNGVVSP